MATKVRGSASGPLPLLFLIIISAAIIAGFIYYKYQRKSLLTEKQHDLSMISYLKIRQISQWRDERLGDGRFLGENVILLRKFSEYLQNPEEINVKADILQSLKSFTENFDIKGAVLLDRSGDAKLTYPPEDSLMGNHLKPLLAVTKQSSWLTDLHTEEPVNYIHIDLIVPLIDRGNDTAAIGFLALQIDPNDVLFPLIQTWEISDRSAEILLVEKEKDDVVYLNRLVNDSGKEVLLRRSASEERLTSAMAVQGITSTIAGVDYKDVEVVAAMNKIPGTTWYLLTKIDSGEILSVLYTRMKIAVLMLILLISATGSFLAFKIKNNRADYYKAKYEDELDRLALIKHFDYILKYANDIILLIDSNLIIVEANDRALEYYQYQRSEFIGMKLEHIRADESMDQMTENLKIVNDRGFNTFETVHIRKDRTKFPLEISSRAVTIEGNKYYQSIGRDITDRKRAEETLRDSENRFRKIFEESPFSTLMTGKDFIILRANASFSRFIGYSEDELKSFTFRNFTHPEHIDNDAKELLRLIAGEIPVYKAEKRYICKDGTIVWGSTTVSTIKNENDEVQFFLVMIEDITARKKALLELDNSVSLLKATFESTEDGLLVVNSSGRIVQFNQKFINMWKVPSDILMSGDDIKAMEYLKHGLKNPDMFIDNVKFLNSRPDETSSDLLEFVDGRYFERYSQPQKLDGKSVGRVWSFRDITNKKKAESELIAAKEKAEESDRLKTAFLHNVSHEIRTPMNAIIGFSSLLKEPDVTKDEESQYIDIISQSGGQLLSIINDIVDIASVESGQAKVNLVELKLNPALRSLNEQFGINLKPNISISLETSLEDDDSVILTDNTKLIQILSNLINNAVKFTHQGSIHFGYTLKDGFLEFFVKDTGIGIPPDYKHRIFDRFYQVDSAISRQFSGTGLGLSICKGYVELMGGTIWVESEPGSGTDFYFTIPYSKV